MPNQLPSGRWRARVVHPRTGKQINPAEIIGGPTTHEDEERALLAESEADQLLRQSARAGVTVHEWRTDWTTDPLWLRPSESTNIHNRERTARFVAVHGAKPIRAIDDDIVASWLRGGNNRSTIPALRAMFNDASSAAAGRLVTVNPFANLRLPSSRGRKDVMPPDQAVLASMLALARELTPPSFAAYTVVGAHTAMRPGELDGLRNEYLDFQKREIKIEWQWNAKTRAFSRPKHEHRRTVAMTPPAYEALVSLPRESEFAFTTLRGTHYTPSARVHHWNRVRCAAGLGKLSLYTCTRHFFGWYALNILRLDPHDIAQQLGHRDGGHLVRNLYGHPDAAIARERIKAAYADAPTAPVPLRAAS